MRNLASRGVVYGPKRCRISVSMSSVSLQPKAENRCEAIKEYLPRIIKQISTLEQVIAHSGSQPLVVNDIISWFAFDSMGEFAFNENFGMMKLGKWHYAVTQQRSALALLGLFSPAIWIIRLAFAFVPFLSRMRDWAGMLAFCDSRMKQRLKVSCPSSFFSLCLRILLRQRSKNPTSQPGSSKNSPTVGLRRIREPRGNCYVVTQSQSLSAAGSTKFSTCNPLLQNNAPFISASRKQTADTRSHQ